MNEVKDQKVRHHRKQETRQPQGQNGRILVAHPKGTKCCFGRIVNDVWFDP